MDPALDGGTHQWGDDGGESSGEEGARDVRKGSWTAEVRRAGPKLLQPGCAMQFVNACR